MIVRVRELEGGVHNQCSVQSVVKEEGKKEQEREQERRTGEGLRARRKKRNNKASRRPLPL